jgi:predicted O-methyltransferase YrrM
MLEQIERRLAKLQKERDMQEKDTAEIRANAKAPGSKVVAIDVDPEMYTRLQEVAKKHGVRGVRGALALAARTGLRHL